MVEPRPDVPHALFAVVDELLPLRQLGELELLLALVDAEDAGARLALVFEAQQAAMLRIEVEEQAVVDDERLRRGRARRGEAQHRIRAVAVVVDQLFAGLRGTGRAGGPEAKPSERVGGDFRVLRLDLAPGDLAVLVGVERDRVVEIAKRDVPLPVDPLAIDLEREIAVGRLVRMRDVRGASTRSAASAQGHARSRRSHG